MKLNKFQSSKNKKQIILVFSILFVMLIAGVVLYRTYSLFEESKNYNVIKGSVPDYIDNYDVKVALTIDGAGANIMPERDSGKAIESITCDKGAKGYWDYVNWALNVDDLTTTRTRCQVNFVTRYTDSILYGTDPVLKDGMIPVEIDNNGVVTKADLNSAWYDYSNQKWANVVLLTEQAKSNHYNSGDIINENYIESYFVWIPRYRYKLFNKENGNYPEQTEIENKEQIIDIIFEHKDSVRVSEGNKYGEWLTHPAFTSFDVNGMWIGKFETGYKNAKIATDAQKNVNDSTKVWIKPNVYSWIYTNVANAYLTSIHYKEEYISHMMKNTEWGAVAYLQHSKYGSGNTSVRINNNEAFITGYGAVNEPTTGYTASNISCQTHKDACNEYGKTNLGGSSSIMSPWNTESGRLASTTGNMYGVYDMSGGAWEYVMGVMLDFSNTTSCSGRDVRENSGFNGPYCNVGETESLTTGVEFSEDTRYYDVYTYGTTSEGYNRRILGDATGEMGPFLTKTYGTQQRQIGSWHADEAWFIHSNNPWFRRGGNYPDGKGTGVFNFCFASGSAYSNASFRIVLSPSV